MDVSLFLLENFKVLTKDIISPVNFNLFWEGPFWLLIIAFLYNSLCILIWVVPNKTWSYSARNKPIIIVSTISRQYKQTFNPIPNLWANIPIEDFVILCLLLFFLTVAFFTAEIKEKKKKKGRVQTEVIPDSKPCFH